jgi:hypothetical protein
MQGYAIEDTRHILTSMEQYDPTKCICSLLVCSCDFLCICSSLPHFFGQHDGHLPSDCSGLRHDHLEIGGESYWQMYLQESVPNVGYDHWERKPCCCIDVEHPCCCYTTWFMVDLLMQGGGGLWNTRKPVQKVSNSSQLHDSPPNNWFGLYPGESNSFSTVINPRSRMNRAWWFYV